MVLGACIMTAAASAHPALFTAKADYFPGDTVMVTGGGWLPHEDVTLTFFENPIHHEPRGFMAITDSSGRIRNDEYVIGEQQRGSLCTVFAYGEASGLLATATITCHAGGTNAAAAGRPRASGRERAADPRPRTQMSGGPSVTGKGVGLDGE